MLHLYYQYIVHHREHVIITSSGQTGDQGQQGNEGPQGLQGDPGTQGKQSTLIVLFNYVSMSETCFDHASNSIEQQ